MEIIGMINEYLHTFSAPVVLIRMLLALLLSGIVGYSRSAEGRAAGFKTYAIVCVGASLVMLTGQFIYLYMGYNTGDVARLPAQVINGVGFLGAGTIMVTGKRRVVRGLSTAAGLWVCACIGLAMGSGYYSGAIATTAIVYIVYRHTQWINDMAHESSTTCEVVVEFIDRKYVSSFMSAIDEKGFRLQNMSMSKEKDEGGKIRLLAVLELPAMVDNQEVYSMAVNLEGVESVELR